MKAFAVFVVLMMGMANALPLGFTAFGLAIMRRDGSTEFDPDTGFKARRDGSTEFDPDTGFKAKRDGSTEFVPDTGFTAKRDGSTEFDPDTESKR